MLLPYFFTVEFRQPQLPVFYHIFYRFVFYSVCLMYPSLGKNNKSAILWSSWKKEMTSWRMIPFPLINKCCTHKTFAWIEFPWEVSLYKKASEAAALFLDAA